jgi:alkaline phosphatase D
VVKTGKSTEFTLAFGSCNKQFRDMSLWKDVADERADAFAWLGDVVYADEKVRLPDGSNARVYKGEDAHLEAYAVMKAHSEYARIRANADVVGTWDDHDYGFNNAGKHWSHKDFAKKAFLDFLDEPEGSERRTRDGGVYDAVDYVNDEGRRVRVILLDLRWDLEESDESSSGSFMSETQWAWFGDMLAAEPRPDVTIIGSGIQVLEAPHLILQPLAKYVEPARLIAEGLENWSRNKREKDRLFATIKSTKSRVVFISGDVHHGQIAVEPAGCYLPYKTIDVTASGFTHTPFREPREPIRTLSLFATPRYFNSWILPAFDRWTGINYGVIEVDWKRGEVRAMVKSTGRETVLEESMAFADFDEDAPEKVEHRTGCSPIIEMSYEERGVRIVLFFAWLASVYAAHVVVPAAFIYVTYRSLKRRAAAKRTKVD